MIDYFTSVKKSSIRNCDSISRLFTASLKISETHAISPPEIRDTEVWPL